MHIAIMIVILLIWLCNSPKSLWVAMKISAALFVIAVIMQTYYSYKDDAERAVQEIAALNAEFDKLPEVTEEAEKKAAYEDLLEIARKLDREAAQKVVIEDTVDHI